MNDALLVEQRHRPALVPRGESLAQMPGTVGSERFEQMRHQQLLALSIAVAEGPSGILAPQAHETDQARRTIDLCGAKRALDAERTREVAIDPCLAPGRGSIRSKRSTVVPGLA